MEGHEVNKKRKRYKLSTDDLIFEIITKAFLLIFVVLVLYPLFFVVVASVTDPIHVNSGELLFYPKGFTLLGYQRVFSDNRIMIGYANTIFYTIAGTALGVSGTMLAAYALSRSDLPGRRIIMILFIFTMYFQGGMIPYYLVVKGLNLVNRRLFMVLAGCISVYNIIIAKSFMESNITEELRDAARIDGCGNGHFFARIVLPLSKAVIAVIALYLAVTYWNSYFNGMIFLTDEKKYPLQLFLREILLTTSQAASVNSNLDPEATLQLEQMGQVIKYGVIVVSTVPIICVYPFVQKYFVKGVMIGSVKG
jgi:putative aldouronate transport system permease protein